MLKRQESSLSSSRRHNPGAATPPPSETHHAKAIGCMSGIFQLFSKYQNPNKRLTFGRRQEKSKPPSPAKSKKSPPATEGIIEKQNLTTCGIKVTMSPTRPPEIGRSDGDDDDDDASAPPNARTPLSSSLVARLMGLEAAKNRPADKGSEDLTTEKRRQLLQALEKCNDDLEALKRIIKAVQEADMCIQPKLAAADERTVHPGGGNAVTEETNIPANVAEELTRSPPNSSSIVQNSTAVAIRVPQQSKPTGAVKKPGEDDESIAKRILNKSTIIDSSLRMRREAAIAVTQPWCSRAMVKSVEEVCGDISWGEKREIGRIVLVLQDHLCRELVEEFVRELKSCSIIHSLPFEACKRRLCF